MAAGVEFTGSGKLDCKHSPDSTAYPEKSDNIKSGGVEFTGKGTSDLTGGSVDTSQGQPGAKAVPAGGNVSFAGDGKKDV